MTNKQKPPGQLRRFYAIEDNGDGTVDVYLMPEVSVYPTPDGFKEYDVQVRIVRGVAPWPEMEEDIRRRYDAWCENGKAVEL